ncbi:MAG: hypothetical protein JWO48_1201 [Bryobacterales bacterium]|nr:hypothetical protein [Bryobacterales bacterium]
MPQAKRELEEIMAWLDRYSSAIETCKAFPSKRMSDLRKAFPSIRSHIEAEALIDIWKYRPGPGSTWSPAKE